MGWRRKFWGRVPLRLLVSGADFWRVTERRYMKRREKRDEEMKAENEEERLV